MKQLPTDEEIYIKFQSDEFDDIADIANTNGLRQGAKWMRSQAQPIITELQKSLAMEHSINAGLQKGNERLLGYLHRITYAEGNLREIALEALKTKEA